MTNEGDNGSVMPMGMPAGASGGMPPGAPSGSSAAGPGPLPAGPEASSPIQKPSPNLGAQAQGMAYMAVAVRLLSMAAQHVDPGSPAGKAVFRSIESLTRQMPAGAASPGVEKMALMTLMQSQQRGAAGAQLHGGGVMPPAPPQAPTMSPLQALGGGGPAPGPATAT